MMFEKRVQQVQNVERERRAPRIAAAALAMNLSAQALAQEVPAPARDLVLSLTPETLPTERPEDLSDGLSAIERRLQEVLRAAADDVPTQEKTRAFAQACQRTYTMAMFSQHYISPMRRMIMKAYGQDELYNQTHIATVRESCLHGEESQHEAQTMLVARYNNSFEPDITRKNEEIVGVVSPLFARGNEKVHLRLSVLSGVIPEKQIGDNTWLAFPLPVVAPLAEGVYTFGSKKMPVTVRVHLGIVPSVKNPDAAYNTCKEILSRAELVYTESGYLVVPGTSGADATRRMQECLADRKNARDTRSPKVTIGSVTIEMRF